MDQNIIVLIIKFNGYPDLVALSGCHGNQVKFIWLPWQPDNEVYRKLQVQNFHIQKIPNFVTIKIQLKFLHLRVIYEVYGLFKFNSWKTFFS